MASIPKSVMSATTDAALARTPARPEALIAILVAVVGGLYFGQEVLVPLALAILISFALAPIVVRLGRWGLGRVPSVIAAVSIVFVLLSGFGVIVTTQLVDLGENLPTYESNLRGKIRALQGAAPSGGLIDSLSAMVQDLSRDLDAGTGRPAARSADGGPAGAKPVPVEIYERPSSPAEVLRQVAGPLIGPLGTAGLVLIFIIFMLLERESLRDRLIRLVGATDVRRTTTAMDDAAQRVGRYLLMQLVVNILYGIPIAIGLYLIGVPNPLLWGLLATVLHFIPYVGTAIAAFFPIALSFAVAPGWLAPALTITLFIAVEFTSSNMLEPWLFGSSTGLSPTAILVAAAFWVMLWGPIGLLLATPLTVCLVVLGRHVPQLAFLDVMLGNEPVLPMEVKFYQRLLARDPEEAAELADEFLEDRPLGAFYDLVAMPALALAEQDRVRRGLPRDVVDRLAADAIAAIEDLGDELPGVEPALPPLILCAGARNSLDDAAAVMLAHLLVQAGQPAKPIPRDLLASHNLPHLDQTPADVICLCSVNPAAVQHASRLVRRVRQHLRSRPRLLVCLWNAELPPDERFAEQSRIGADMLVVSLREAVTKVAASTGSDHTPSPLSEAATQAVSAHSRLR